MLYFPNGVMDGEVVDPDRLAQEFIKAANLADQTNQWSWNAAALNALTDLVGRDCCRSEQKFIACDLQSSNDPAINPSLAPILPYAAGYDTNIWQIPFKRGLLPIGDNTPNGRLQVQWTTEYPELVMCVLTCQYVRDRRTIDNGLVATEPVIRAQVRMQLDGQILPGSGPMAHPVYSVRGIGYGASAAALTDVWIGIVPAGTHVLMGVAGQGDNAAAGVDYEFQDQAPVEGVAIATRNLFALRFARGDTIKG